MLVIYEESLHDARSTIYKSVNPLTVGTDADFSKCSTVLLYLVTPTDWSEDYGQGL
jgi:hypothetical protein